ncbi:uncharacterized protein N7511_010517 [Penicillium nucicola]|uniref:uncharacterized protein n=1 Tax=Penicillium nucicola TaxID=1850975 RepID=UPI0025454C39|nr:uncharacterized protein N7511_010517 [Penicillium nucicola]KAJ5748821.1 hypothetical protein N7511_010517 [Penicillium nucicola]
MGQTTEVTLFPWDSNSDAHVELLVKQRVECSWHQEKVETEWKGQQLRGEKCIYWIVLSSPDSQVDAEDEKLQDTASSINAVARQPTKARFTPIGHISLDSKNVEIEHLDLDLPSENIFWIKTFYIRQHIQGQGIGRAAMNEVETMAVQEPLNAKTLMLDTVQKDDQKNEEFANVTYGGIPKTTNEEWYSRRGYRLVKTVQNFYRVADKNGKIWDIKTVFMRKDIAASDSK